MRRHHQLEGLLSKITSSAVLAALRPKTPASHADSTVYSDKQLVIIIIVNFTAITRQRSREKFAIFVRITATSASPS